VKVIDTPLNGCILIEPDVYGDERGFFKEIIHPQKMDAIGIRHQFVQINQSRSQQWTLRGFHFQKAPYAQSKLVRCLRGSIYDVAVDIRPNSPTFGQSYGVELSDENHLMFYIPEGFAHALLTLTEVDIEYACGDMYAPDFEDSIIWNDPALGVDWPLPDGKAPILSEKDGQSKLLADIKDSLHWPDEVYANITR
jgi:dTDP-4-dehydrorhamnose 3,5-epimerase